LKQNSTLTDLDLNSRITYLELIEMNSIDYKPKQQPKALKMIEEALKRNKSKQPRD